MRAVIKPDAGPGAAFVHDHSEPDLAHGQVRIEVAAASVCGTDIELYESTEAATTLGLTYPRVLGHEVAGVVVEVGSQVAGLPVGTAVALESHLHCGQCWFCRNGRGHNCGRMQLLGVHVDGGFAERLVAPAASCFTLPSGLDMDAAALLEPAGSAMHAVLRCGVPMAGSAVLVSGAGPVGLVLARIATVMGAREVTVVEPQPGRRTLANSLGLNAIDVTVDPVAVGGETTRARGGFDVAFDCSGALPALDGLLRAVRREATVMTVGLVNGDWPVSVTRTLITRGVTLRGSFGRSLWETWDVLGELVADGRVDLGALVTDRLALGELPYALQLMRNGAGKVLLQPGLPDVAADVADEEAVVAP